MSTVLITGGTGLIGKLLCSALHEQGYSIKLLSRTVSSQSTYPTFHWNPDTHQISQDAFKDVDYIVHLAGENIGEQRWSENRKKRILESRMLSGQLLLDTIQQKGIALKGFISASAIGYYGGITSKKIFSEDDGAATDFLGQVCQAWESTAQGVADLGIRTTTLRIGVVLTPTGGALSKLAFPIRLWAGAALGSGRQYLPWIHVDDLIAIISNSIRDEKVSGVYNAVAPQHITNEDMTKQIAQILKRPLLLPRIPGFILKLIMGEMSAIVLEGSRVSSGKIENEGFSFLYPEVDQALKNLLKGD